MTNSDTKNFSQNVSSSYYLEDRGKCNKNTCTNARNVPKLRFKGYNDEWIEKTFDEIFQIIGNNTLSRDCLNYECMGTKNIHYGDILVKYNTCIDEDYCKMPIINPEISLDKIPMENYLKQGDIVIADTAEDYTVGKTCEVINIHSKILSGLHTIPSRPKFHFAKGFLGYYFNSNKYHDRLIPIITGIKVSSINKREIKKTIVKFPTLPEQEKIASFLTLIDKKIEKQKELVELLKKYKRGLLSAIFSQKMRFKDDNGNDYPAWEEKYIQDVCLITTGKGNTQDKEENGIYPFYVRSPIIEKSNKYLFDGEAVLTVGDGVGTGKVFHYVNGKFNFHQRVYKMSNFSGINGKYFYYYFSTYFYDRVKRMTAKTSVDSVRMDMIAKMPIFIPTNEEQDKIINLLTNVENIFLKNENQLLLLQEYKKGLLQQMFI